MMSNTIDSADWYKAIEMNNRKLSVNVLASPNAIISRTLDYTKYLLTKNNTIVKISRENTNV